MVVKPNPFRTVAPSQAKEAMFLNLGHPSFFKLFYTVVVVVVYTVVT